MRSASAGTEPGVAGTWAEEQLVRTAERLIAMRGIDGVSLRQISAAAGNGNNSAVQYHFGSKENLIQAVFEFRLPGLNARRERLLDERSPGELRGWVECFVLPLTELAEQADSHYLTFVAQLATSGLEYPFDRVPEPYARLANRFLDQFRAHLPGMPEPLRSVRISHALMSCVHACSDRERARALDAPVLPHAVHSRDLVDGLVGFLRAPVSTATLDALRGAEIPPSARLRIP